MAAMWSRRHFLGTSAGLVLATTLGGQRALAAGSVFDALRAKWRELYLGTGFDPSAEPYRSKLVTLGETASRWRSAMAARPGELWSDLSYADPEPDRDTESYRYTDRMSNSFYRLRTMAEAYVQPGTGVTADPSLRDAVLTGLDHLYADIYHENRAEFGNWWHFQIGTPQALMDTAILMYDHLSAAQINNFCNAVDKFLPDSIVSRYTGTSTGANRVDLCRGIILSGVVRGREDRILVGARALSPVFPRVTSGDGFYADGSFLQHSTVPYIGGYGAVLFDGLGRLFALLSGTPWDITDPNKQLMLDNIENALAPFIYNGVLMDNVSGRGVTRADSNDHRRAHGPMASILLLGMGASPTENARWRSMVKGWLARDYYLPAHRNPRVSLAAAARFQALWDDPAVGVAPEPVEHRNFPNMDRLTHRRPGWAASISMASQRIAHYEYGNLENYRGWHTGSGWLLWWRDAAGLEQYSDAYWPTVDPYRMPGTTVSTKPLADGEGGSWGALRPDTTWVGGTTDGEFGTTGQHLRGPASTMQARKSWFWLDDSVVCLGSSISSTDGARVQTTVDNRRLDPATGSDLVLDGVVQPNVAGWSAGDRHTTWAHLAGHAGYVFAGGAVVNFLREDRTGRWRDVNGTGPAEAITQRYLTMWLDHGMDPQDGSYAYILMPGAGVERTAERAADPEWLQILANDSHQTGISVPSRGFTGINFWTAGTAGKVTASAPVAVQIRQRHDRTATICVADPARSVRQLTLTWNRPTRSVLSGPSTLLEAHTGPRLTLTFADLSTSRGATHRVVVAL